MCVGFFRRLDGVDLAGHVDELVIYTYNHTRSSARSLKALQNTFEVVSEVAVQSQSRGPTGFGAPLHEVNELVKYTVYI